MTPDMLTTHNGDRLLMGRHRVTSGQMDFFDVTIKPIVPGTDTVEVTPVDANLAHLAAELTWDDTFGTFRLVTHLPEVVYSLHRANEPLVLADTYMRRVQALSDAVELLAVIQVAETSVTDLNRLLETVTARTQLVGLAAHTLRYTAAANSTTSKQLAA